MAKSSICLHEDIAVSSSLHVVSGYFNGDYTVSSCSGCLSPDDSGVSSGCDHVTHAVMVTIPACRFSPVFGFGAYAPPPHSISLSLCYLNR